LKKAYYHPNQQGKSGQDKQRRDNFRRRMSKLSEIANKTEWTVIPAT
jgi:hypothetical protein